jgi:hypothetical protein
MFMHSLRNALLCLAAVPAITLAQSGSIDLLNFAPSDAQILAGANVNAAKSSPFGQFVLSQMEFGDSIFQKFVTDTGFDPRTDLSEVLIASTEMSGNISKFFIAAHGSFSQAMTAVEGAVAAHNATIIHLPGVDVIVPPAAQRPMASVCVAFFTDGNTALMGDCVMVNAAALSKGAASAVSSALAAKAQQWRKQSDLWFTSVLPLTQFAGVLPANGPLAGLMNTDLFKGIQQTSGGIKLASSSVQGPSIQVSGEALMDTPQNATALANIVNFIAGLIQTAKPNNPPASMFTSLLASLQASASGNTVSVNLTIPETTLEQIFTSRNRMAMSPGPGIQLHP